MSYKHIVLSNRGPVAWLEIDRADRRNSLTDDTHNEIIDALHRISVDDSVRVLVLSGRGTDFCVGAEMSYDHPSESMLIDESPEGVRLALRHMQKITRMLHEMEKPSIAMVNGAAAGAGMDFALACDIRLGSPTARFRSFMQVGLVPGLGGAWLMVKLIGYGRACEMFLSGRIIRAEEAKNIGLLNYVVAEEELEKTAFVIAGRIAEQAPIAVKLGKMMLREALKTDFNTSAEFAAAFQPIVMTAKDHTEARKAFLEKRQPKYQGR